MNLNFTNENEIAGPEFVVNPARIQKHEELVAETLPAEFLDDLAVMREKLERASSSEGPDPSGIIGASRVSPHGMVAFVDEATHHKTPTYGHRTVMPGSLRFYLEKEFSSEYEAATTAFKEYNARSFFYWGSSFSSYYTGASPERAAMWGKLLELAGRKEARVGRPELLAAGLSQDRIDDLMERFGSTDFTEVSLPHTQQTNIPVREKGRPPLKRQMSELALGLRIRPIDNALSMDGAGCGGTERVNLHRSALPRLACLERLRCPEGFVCPRGVPPSQPSSGAGRSSLDTHGARSYLSPLRGRGGPRAVPTAP